MRDSDNDGATSPVRGVYVIGTPILCIEFALYLPLGDPKLCFNRAIGETKGASND